MLNVCLHSKPTNCRAHARITSVSDVKVDRGKQMAVALFSGKSQREMNGSDEDENVNRYGRRARTMTK